MAEISSYPLKTPKSGDLITFSETYDANAANPVIGNPTKSATVGSINALAVNGTVNKIALFTTASSVGDSIITQNASKIGIGTDNPQRELHVSGGVRITSVLDLFQGDDNTFAGTDAGNLFNIGGGWNTGFGKNSQAVQVSGNSNSSLGFNSLANSISGNNNTAIGTNSMTLSNGGSFNTGVGSNSLSKATVGQGNTAIGFSALGEKTSSNFNTAVGNSSLSNITTGFRNTAVGNEAGKFVSDGVTPNSTGRNSVFIGDSAKANADNETNQIVIGVGAVGNGSNTTTIGSAGTISTEIKGNVGIGTASPSSALEVVGKVTSSSLDINGTSIAGSQLTSIAVKTSTGTQVNTWIDTTATPTSNATGDAYGAVIRAIGSGPNTDKGLIGVNPVGRQSGTGGAEYAYGVLATGEQTGSGNIDFIIGVDSRASSNGNGIATTDYIRGVDAEAKVNNANATVDFLQGIHAAANLTTGTVGEVNVNLLDWDYTAGSVTGDLSYIRIQNDNYSGVAGTARAIHSLAQLPSLFSGTVEVAGGDIETSTSTNGLILKSPDGTRYRVTVANGGALTVSAV